MRTLNCGLINPDQFNVAYINGRLIQSLSDGGVIRWQTDRNAFESFVPTAAPNTCTISPNANNQRIDIKAGTTMITIGGKYLVNLSANVTRDVSQAWVQGGVGGRFGSHADNTSYHVFVIHNPTTGVVDVGIDTSALALNRPSGWNARRIGSFLYRGGVILPFTQSGLYFEHSNIQLDHKDVALTTGLKSLTVPADIQPLACGYLSSGTAAQGFSVSYSIQSPVQDSLIPVSSPIFGSFRGMTGTHHAPSSLYVTTAVIWFSAQTNTAAQVYITATGSPVYYPVLITTGWYDIALLAGT